VWVIKKHLKLFMISRQGVTMIRLIFIFILLISTKAYSTPELPESDSSSDSGWGARWSEYEDAARSETESGVGKLSESKKAGLSLDLTSDSSLKQIREILSDGKESGEELLAEAERVAKHTIDSMGNVFQPDKLLYSAIATTAGLTLGEVFVEGTISGADKVLGFILNKLTQDMEKINYEIFYNEFFKLGSYLDDLDNLSNATEKMKKLMEIKNKISPLYKERINEKDINAFAKKVVCHSSLDVFQQAKTRSNIKDMISMMNDSSGFDQRFCYKMAKIDELNSRIDSIYRILVSKFDDMKNYRLAKVEEEATNSFNAYVKDKKEHNPHIDKYRNIAFSCLSDPNKIKGTELELLSKNKKIKDISGDEFDFKKVWNHYFSSEKTALTNGFDLSNSQKEFEIELLDKVNTIGCDGQFYGGLNECIKGMTGDKVEFENDTMALQSILLMKAKELTGEELTTMEKMILSQLGDHLDEESMSFIKNPFGNMIMISGPKSVNFTKSAISSRSNQPNINRAAREIFAPKIKGLEKINDISLLSCDHDYIMDKSLCMRMLKGMKEVIQGSCNDQFNNNNIKEKALVKIEKDILDASKKIDLAILKEKVKLRKLKDFVHKYSTSGTEKDLESQIREISNDYKAFIRKGYCR